MITHDDLERHRLLAIQLKEVKEQEMALRVRIAGELNKDNALGTKRYDQEGYKVKLKTSLNYNLDQDMVAFMLAEDMLSSDELACLRTKYDLRLKEYKECDDTSVLDDAVETKFAAPTLEITLGE